MKSKKPLIIVLITLFLLGNTIQPPVHSNSKKALQDTAGFVLTQNEWLTESFELGGSRDCFVTLFENDGQSVNCSFIVGGDNVEYSSATAIDSDGNIYITGKTKSENFPLENPYQSTHGDGYDFYVCKFSHSSDTIPQTDLLLEIVIVSSILGAILVIGIVLKKRG